MKNAEVLIPKPSSTSSPPQSSARVAERQSFQERIRSLQEQLEVERKAHLETKAEKVRAVCALLLTTVPLLM